MMYSFNIILNQFTGPIWDLNSEHERRVTAASLPSPSRLAGVWIQKFNNIDKKCHFHVFHSRQLDGEIVQIFRRDASHHHVYCMYVCKVKWGIFTRFWCSWFGSYTIRSSSAFVFKKVSWKKSWFMVRLVTFLPFCCFYHIFLGWGARGMSPVRKC